MNLELQKIIRWALEKKIKFNLLFYIIYNFNGNKFKVWKTENTIFHAFWRKFSSWSLSNDSKFLLPQVSRIWYYLHPSNIRILKKLGPIEKHLKFFPYPPRISELSEKKCSEVNRNTTFILISSSSLRIKISIIVMSRSFEVLEDTDPEGS